MPNRDERVIKGLEWIKNDIEENGNMKHAGQYLPEIINALELLKEQEKQKKHRLPFLPDSNVQWTT